MLLCHITASTALARAMTTRTTPNRAPVLEISPSIRRCKTSSAPSLYTDVKQQSTA